MDALEFLRELKRMCDSYKSCEGCPFDDIKCSINALFYDDEYDKSVDIVEQWSKEHPRKTRQSVFLEKYPEAEIDVNGVVGLCPMSISAVHRDSNGECNYPERLCRDCRREFWMQEVE